MVRIPDKVNIDVAAKKAPSLAELRKLVQLVADHAEHNVKEMTGGNPQIVDARKQNQARFELASAILEAMRGDLVALRILTGK